MGAYVEEYEGEYVDAYLRYGVEEYVGKYGSTRAGHVRLTIRGGVRGESAGESTWKSTRVSTWMRTYDTAWESTWESTAVRGRGMRESTREEYGGE